MRNAIAIGRLVGLATGIGIGAALAATPGIAAAAPDIDISFNGMDVFHTDHHTAQAFSSANDLAIAIGPDSHAAAGAGDFPGQLDVAFANGVNAFALSGLGNSDSAFANGAGALAEAGGGFFNLASVFGDNSIATAGFGGDSDVAEVLGNSLTSSTATGGSFLTDFLTPFGDFNF